MSLLSFLRSLYSWFYPGKDDERHPSPIYTAQEDNESYYSPPIRRHTQVSYKASISRSLPRPKQQKSLQKHKVLCKYTCISDTQKSINNVLIRQ